MKFSGMDDQTIGDLGCDERAIGNTVISWVRIGKSDNDDTDHDK